MVNFILRMAAVFDARKQQLVFLINNYDMMLSVYNEQTAETTAAKAEFEQQLGVRGSIDLSARSPVNFP